MHHTRDPKKQKLRHTRYVSKRYDPILSDFAFFVDEKKTGQGSFFSDMMSIVFLGSSVVEQVAVNHRAVGSSPARGASLRILTYPKNKDFHGSP
jgi:hypothetical protein